MPFLANLWFTFLYQPLFNALIWIYSNVANNNLGWAVIWLTIFLRIALLPLTLLSERNNIRRKKAVVEAHKANAAYAGDSIAQKEAARKIMRRYKISPWAKVLMLLIQLLILILLYQVFISGINGDRVAKVLYPSIDNPGVINTNFYTFEIGQRHNALWAGIAAGYLFISIFIETRRRPVWDRSELYYAMLFPLFTFAALWYLPMVKSLFILTTMLFSDTIGLLSFAVFSLFKAKPVQTETKKIAH